MYQYSGNYECINLRIYSVPQNAIEAAIEISFLGMSCLTENILLHLKFLEMYT